MKSILFILGFLFLSVAQAQLAPETLRYHRVSNCTFWSYTNGYYACSGYPYEVQVPDAQSTLDNLNQLDARIKKLEAKIQALEAKQSNNF